MLCEFDICLKGEETSWLSSRAPEPSGPGEEDWKNIGLEASCEALALRGVPDSDWRLDRFGVPDWELRCRRWDGDDIVRFDYFAGECQRFAVQTIECRMERICAFGYEGVNEGQWREENASRRVSRVKWFLDASANFKCHSGASKHGHIHRDGLSTCLQSFNSSMNLAFR